MLDTSYSSIRCTVSCIAAFQLINKQEQSEVIQVNFNTSTTNKHNEFRSYCLILSFRPSGTYEPPPSGDVCASVSLNNVAFTSHHHRKRSHHVRHATTNNIKCVLLCDGSASYGMIQYQNVERFFFGSKRVIRCSVQSAATNTFYTEHLSFIHYYNKHS